MHVFQPSSSSRAAELLTQSGSTPTGFVGFQGLGGAHAYVPASQAFDDVDTCLDSDFRVVLRKLTKRDATTKIKVSHILVLFDLCFLPIRLLKMFSFVYMMLMLTLHAMFIFLKFINTFLLYVCLSSFIFYFTECKTEHI